MSLQFTAGIRLKRESIAPDGSFAGYASTFGNVDSFGDTVEAGAFGKSLKAWSSRGKWPPLMLAHGGCLGNPDDAIPVGAITELREDATGLAIKARLLALKSDRGQRLHEAMKAGTLDGLSIGYIPIGVRYGRGSGEAERTLTDIDLKEVSLCPWPADNYARVTSVKAESPRELEDLLRQRGFRRREAKRIVAGGWRAYSHDSNSPDLGAAAARVLSLTAALRGE